MDHERILLAESHDGYRQVTRRQLERAGHTVVAETGTLRNLRRIMATDNVLFRVAVISSHLPRMGDGEEAAKLVYRLRPEVVVVSYSGLQHQTFGKFNVYKGDGHEVLLETIKNSQFPKTKP